MVLIHCKYKGEEHSFLYETTVEIAVKDLIKELVEVHNLRLRLHPSKTHLHRTAMGASFVGFHLIGGRIRQ